MGVDNQAAFKEVIKMIRPGEASKQKQGLAKMVSIIILTSIFIIGVIGSFDFAKFSMESYVQFLDVAMWPLITFIMSVGVGSVIRTKTTAEPKKRKDKENEGTVE